MKDLMNIFEHSPLQAYDNKIEEQVCPKCGKTRPKDWFVPLSDECWQCRSRVPKARHKTAKVS